ncbi:MAG: hypothetical protein EAZ14_09495 [Runella slithyformis]|nr:MAG: hypothetical protein EAZ46_04660 [Runella sp.]TAG20961.1 MAG: hypothetical protein EAZ38_09150 [Cytophagales bacterium]TAG40118.1 MAG: hypothetical protein EAZ32_07730 [Cytophagia bacterium]TAG57316.1 MAG: hypothetical protein EAZ29_02230 [Runella slithyformis]TAG81758.1 MAG: hypothetical protein EAZ22_06580 [Cytophagales bacterium]
MFFATLIWIQENSTKIKMAQELVRKGAPKTDIVWAIQLPQLRA